MKEILEQNLEKLEERYAKITTEYQTIKTRLEAAIAKLGE